MLCSYCGKAYASARHVRECRLNKLELGGDPDRMPNPEEPDLFREIVPPEPPTDFESED